MVFFLIVVVLKKVPAVKWVLNGRIIQNNTQPLHSSNMDQIYVISEKALAEGKMRLSSMFYVFFMAAFCRLGWQTCLNILS